MNRQSLIEQAFIKKNKKIIEEQNQTTKRLESFVLWQEKWFGMLNIFIFIEKLASIRRASELS